MKYLLSFFILASLNISASECNITMFTKVYRLTNNQSLQTKDVIKQSDCSPEITNKLTSLISNSQGTVGSDFLRNELQKDFSDINIHFTNNKLSLLEFDTTLKNQLLADSNLYFTQARSLNGITTLGLTEGEQIQAICDSCQSFGEKSIKVNIANPIENTNRTLWFSAKIMAKIKVVKAKRNISFQQKNLDVNDFYFDEILTSSPENVLTTLDNINFYKSNKTLVQNAIISNIDLQAVNLINYGTPVSVVLLNKNISLQKIAMPLRSARFGETIELKGPNNKNIAGKVIDYNKVVIEL